jgi:hypothetical protein
MTIMVSDQTIKLALQLTGQEKLDQLAKGFDLAAEASKRTAAAVKTTDASVKASGPGVYELSNNYKRLSADLTDSNNALDRVVKKAVEATRSRELMRGMLEESATATTRVDAALGRASAGLKKTGQDGSFAIVELSRGIQDFDADGLHGIANNVEGLTRSFGQLAVGGQSLSTVFLSPAGLISGITLVGTVAAVAGPKLVEFASGLAGVGDKMKDATIPLTERLAEKIKEISERKIKLAVDATELEGAEKRLSEMKAGLAEYEKNRKQTTGAKEQAAGKAVGGLIDEAAGARSGVQEDVRRSVLSEMTAGSATITAGMRKLAAEEKRLADLKSLPAGQAGRASGIATSTADVARLKNELGLARQTVLAEAEAKAGEIIAGGESGSAAGREALAGRLDKAGRGPLAAAVRNAAKQVEGEAQGERVRETAGVVAGASGTDAERAKAEIMQRLATNQAVKAQAEKVRDANIAAREQTEKEQGAKAAKDEKDLREGLGADFIAGAEVERLAVSTLPPWQRGAARKAYQDQVQRAASRKLIEGGAEPGRAAELAGQVVPFVNEDLNRKDRAAAAAGFQAGPERTAAIIDQIRGVGKANEMGLTNQDLLMEATDGLASVGANLLNGQMRQASQITQIGEAVRGLLQHAENTNRAARPGMGTNLRRGRR